ncbi:MAG TPA: long-chain fatty acid--CoA ligase [Candidatus Binataceae bacterium]|nr:long-chain fatty acid--CoA ligase [Candidatus Binataceae bacterium]
MPERARTLPQVFRQQVQKYGARAYLKDKRQRVWHDHSWNAVADAAGRLRAGLLNLGIKPGDRVGILSDNSPQWVIVDQAVLGLGGVVVPLYTTANADETRYIIGDCGAKIVAANGAESVKRLQAIAPELPEMTGIIAIHYDAQPEPAANGAPAVMTLESASAETAAEIVEGSRDELATIIYTSGTTGPPKGVMLSHGNILTNCEDALAVLQLDQRDVILSFLPIAHSFERTAGYYAVTMAGGTIAYAEGLTQIASNLLEIEPTVLLVVPRLLEVIYARVMKTIQSSSPLRRALFNVAVGFGRQAAECRNRGKAVPPHVALAMALFRNLVFSRIRAVFGSRLRYMISGSAPLPTDIYRLLAAAEVPIVEGYGLTEAAPIVSCNLLDGKAKIGTVGMPLPSVEVKTADDGELLVQGPNVMKGYYKREQDTRETIDPDGWLHTGDIATIDAEGYITITDRKKEIIVLSGGKNVSPANLETRLVTDPYIAQACVVGDRRKHLGAVIVPNFENLAEFLSQNALAGKPHDEAVSSPELRRLFHDRLHGFNQTLSDVEAISTFTLVAHPFTQEAGELTPTMKLRRRVVQEHYQEQIEAMYRD